MTDALKTFVRRDLRAAAVPWGLARVLVVGSLALTRFGVDRLSVTHRPQPLRQGLFAWDAAFYRQIAEHGYGPARAALRFFPLFPLLGRGLGFVFFDHDAVALLVVANGSALLFGAVLHALTLRETGDESVATRAAWFGAIFPPAMALVLGYAEGTFMLLVVLVFLALRARRTVWAIPAGLLAGLTRPLGVLLALPAAIEAARGWRDVAQRERLTRAGATLAPLVGTGIYLAWTGAVYGDPWLPFSLQNSRRLRGGTQDPVTRFVEGIGDLIHGDRFGSGLHVLWAALFLALLVVVVRRLPASYSVFAGATILANLTARNLGSFERYAMSAFPLLIAVALITNRPEVERSVMVIAGAGLVGYSILGFMGVSVP